MERQARNSANLLVGKLLGGASAEASTSQSESDSIPIILATNSELPSSQDSGFSSPPTSSGLEAQEAGGGSGHSSQEPEFAFVSETADTAEAPSVHQEAEVEAEAEESTLLMGDVLLGADEQELEDAVAAMSFAPTRPAIALPDDHSALLASLTVDELRDEDLDRMLDEVRLAQFVSHSNKLCARLLDL